MHICKPSEALCLWKRRGKERASERGKKTRRCSAYGGERKRCLRITWKRDGDGDRERERERHGTKERRRTSEGRKREREKTTEVGGWKEGERERESDEKEGERVERREERRASEVETRGSCLAPGSPCSLKQSRRMPPTLADLLCHSETCIPGAGFLSLSYP